MITKLFILDIDVTVMLDDVVRPSTLAKLEQIRAKGASVLFLTNNSSVTQKQVFNRLKKAGVCDDIDEIMTSSMAASLFIKARFPKRRFYIIANDEVLKEFKKSGIDNYYYANGVLLCYDDTINYEKINHAMHLLMKGKKKYIATHPDNLCPSAPLYKADIGGYIEMFKAYTGRTPQYVLGKPNKELGKIIRKSFELKKKEITVVGDRLSTDIKFANDCGFNSVLVRCKENEKADLQGIDINQVVKVFGDIDLNNL